MPKADLQRARELYPSCDMGMEGWLEFFDSGAGFAAMGRILYDIYDEVLAGEEREANNVKMGRRPGRRAVSMDEVMAVVMPQQYQNDPLPIALGRLMNGRSARQFAARVPCNVSTISKIINGQVTPKNLATYESLADAGKVKPWYFVEWRAIFLGQLITEVLSRRPEMGITAMRTVTAARRRGSWTPM